jgi:alpha-methylacyl-CoA racemase
MSTALGHITILDLTRLLPGAVATQTLASFGARVIKIEQPGSGDYARHGFGLTNDINPLFLATNRGKQSLAVDLKAEEGKRILRELVSRSDLLVESFRPGVMDRLDLGYQPLSRINPGLIYVALTGYGQTGEYARLAGHDLNYLAMAGVLNEIGTAERPAMANVQLADIAGGSFQILIGALTALESRHSTGMGQFVDVSMMDGSAALLPVPLVTYVATGKPSRRGNEMLSGRYACYSLYTTSDQRWLTVAALEKKFWAALCSELGCPQYVEHQFAPEPKQQEVKSAVAAVFLTRTAAEWFDRLKDKDCCVAPVRDLTEVTKDPHFERNPIGLTPRLSATPASYGTAAPGLGQHSRSILAEIGYTDQQFQELKASGVVE